MLNTNKLINQINTANRISVSIASPRCITLDNHGYLVTVSDSLNTIVRYDPTNLTIISQPIPPIFLQSPQSITYYNQTYYVGFNVFILVINSNNFTIVQNITAPILSTTRDMMLLNNGQTLVVISTYNNFLLFFNRSNTYSFVKAQNISYASPHGIRFVNDTFFYVTSWNDNTIYSYSAINNSVLWKEQLFLNAKPIAPVSSGAHLTIDDCDRFWFSLGANGMKIFNNQGLLLQNVTQMSPFIFDTVITENYVIYISDMVNNQIIRIDPQIQC